MSTEQTTVFQEDVTANVDVVLQDKLAKANITDHTLSDLKAELSDLAKLSMDEKANRQLVQGGITKAVNIRNNIVRICKKGREGAIMEQNAWIAKEKELVAVVKAVEGPLVQLKSAYQEEQDRIQREEMERQQAAITARFVAIETLGFKRKTTLDGTDTYELEGTTLLVTDISMSESERWANLLRSAQVVSEEMTARKEAERVAAEQAAALAAQEAERIRLAQEAIENQQRELQERQDAFNKQVNEARKNEMLALGVDGECYYKQHFLGESVQAPFHEYTDTEWPLVVARVKEVVGRIAEKEREQEAAAARERLKAERVKALKEAGWVEAPHPQSQEPQLGLSEGGGPFTQAIAIDTLYQPSNETFSNLIDMGRTELARRKKVEQDRIAAEAVEAERKRQEEEATRKAAEEQERKAKLSDVERWDAWMVAIEENAPNLVSAQGAHAVRHLLAYIKNRYAPSVRNELKK